LIFFFFGVGYTCVHTQMIFHAIRDIGLR